VNEATGGLYIITITFTNCLLHPCFFPRYLYFDSKVHSIGAGHDYRPGERHEVASGIYTTAGRTEEIMTKRGGGSHSKNQQGTNDQ